MYCTIKRRNLVILIVALSAVIVSLTVSLVLTSLNSQSEITKINEALTKIEEDNTALQTQLSNMEAKYKSADKTRLNLEKEISLLNKDITSLKSEVNKYKREATEWKNKYLNSDPDDIEYSYSFNSVTELKNAVKKNPGAYFGKTVKVLTVVYEDPDDVYLYMFDSSISSDNTSFEWGYLVYEHNPVPALLDDYAYYAFIDSGDYVKMYGIVSINSDAEICLSSCFFDIIETSDERK